MDNGDVSPHDLRTRAEVCARVGYKGMGLAWADFEANLARHGYDGIRSILRDNDIRYLELEPLFNWYGDSASQAAEETRQAVWLQAAERCGARHIKAVGAIGGAQAPVEVMRLGFERLCKRAEASGALVLLEMVNISCINRLDTAAAVVGDTYQRNGGIALDVWHVSRGKIPHSEIEALPRGIIRWVELDDGTAEPGADLFAEQIDNRLLCGTGSFDLRGFLASVGRTGYTGPYGVEIISKQLRGLPLEQAAEQTYSHATRLFA
jgi:sugar phosphate isomerase/epimerase